MTEQSSSHGNYTIAVKDARGTVIGEKNTIYQYFLSDRYTSLIHNMIAYTTLIEEKTQGFVGRRFVFDALDQFLERSSSGYFIIKGEAGIGKSALMAQLVKAHGYVHHFVVGTQGINRADQFLESVCAQLIAKYELDRPAWLPPEVSRDSAFLSALLQEVSQGLETDQHAVILVDALDEVDWHGRAGENVLFLPPTLPKGVFIVVTMRHKEGLQLQVDSSQVFYLAPDSKGNREDVIAFIAQIALRKTMEPRLEAWGTTVDGFVRTMLVKSEGNFMYLHYVLPAIERGEFRHGTLAELPQGLKDYYERHWRQIRIIDEDLWVTYRQPVICYLATAREPVTVWQVADWSKIAPARVLAAIRDWREFLDEETGEGEKRYRIYHASFQDFLADKDEANEINLRQTHSNVADELLRQWEAMKAGTAAADPTASLAPQVDYVRGLQRLQMLIEQQAPASLLAFMKLEARLLENLDAEARFGSTESIRSGQLLAVAALDDLALRAGLTCSFNQLCR